MKFDLSPLSLIYLSLAAELLSSFRVSAESSATALINKRAACQQFSTSFSSASDVSRTPGQSAFLAISPESTYEVTNDGLRLDLQKPNGQIVRQNVTNSVVGQGATVNSTFMLRYVRDFHFNDLTFNSRKDMES